MHKNEQDVAELTTQITAAYASNNKLPADQLSSVIRGVSRQLRDVCAAERNGKPVGDDRPEPPVKPHNSVRSDHIVCLECGAKLKMLKRHLRAAHNLTPVAYLNRWELSSSTPMTAPKYSAARSELAKQVGLGTKANKNGANGR